MSVAYVWFFFFPHVFRLSLSVLQISLMCWILFDITENSNAISLFVFNIYLFSWPEGKVFRQYADLRGLL